MIKFNQGGGGGYPSKPIYLTIQNIVAVKADTDGATKIITTACENYAAYIVDETIDEVVSAIEEASKKGAD